MSEQQLNRPRDPMILFRSVKRGKNSKGGDRTEMMMNKEQTQLLITELTKNLESPNGVKLDFHISVKDSKDGRKFDSAICFVKPVQDRPGAAPRTFVPAGTPTTDTMQQVEKFKQSLA